MSRQHGAIRWMAAASLTTILALQAAPVTALAAPDSVAGYDYVYGVEQAEATAATAADTGAVEVLTVAGKSGETVYLDIRQGDKTIASHMAFTLSDETGQADANGDLVGVVSVVPTAGVSLDGARITVYADRAETTKLYEGTISTVSARLVTGDATVTVPLGVRTLGDKETRAFAAPSTLEHGGVVYALSSSEPVADGAGSAYVYELSRDTAKSIDGHVTYYDAADPQKVLHTDTVEGIELGSSKTVDVPAVISANGGLYRTLQLSDSYTLAYPGTTEHSVMCVKLSNEWGKAGSFYTAKINYVAEDGTPLSMGDSVVVNKRYLYTPPTRLHLRNAQGEVVSYALSEKNDQLSADGAIVLAPGQAEGSVTYNVVYRPLTDTEQRTWTVTLINGSQEHAGEVIDSVTYRGIPGETASHKTAPQIEVPDGNGGTVTYVPYAAAQETYEHSFGAAEIETEQKIYYVPDTYVAPEAYEVTVNYVNIATGEVISSEAYTASPSMRKDLEIRTPEKFAKEGVEYIRLNGQELPISHCFYSSARAYTVYYRDVNDVAHANTTITNVRVEYVDVAGNVIRRPVTVTDDAAPTTEAADGSASAAEEGTSAEGATAEEAGTDTGIATDETLRAITDGDGAYTAVITDDGTPLSTVRIEDDENPLASGLEGAGSASAAAAVNPAMVAGIVGVSGAAAAAILFFVMKRRKRSDEDASSDDNANA